MKILAVVKLYAHKNKAGGELYLHHLLKELKKYHQVEVLIPESQNTEKNEFEGITINESNERDWKLYLNKADLIITQLDFSSIVMDYALFIKKQIVFILHSVIPRDTKYLKNSSIIKIFNSKSTMELSNRECIGIEGKKFVIYPYTDFLKYQNFATTDLEYRQFITLINPQRIKGEDVFYKLAEYFPKRKFMVVEGGYYPHHQNLRYDLPNVIIQKSTNDMINDVYLKSKIVIQPSRWETYGMVASECRAMGLPCIINKKSEGLYENMGKLSLAGITPDEDATFKNIKTYIDLIELLDHQPTYILWSNLFLEQAEHSFIQQQEQTNDFISYLNSLEH